MLVSQVHLYVAWPGSEVMVFLLYPLRRKVRVILPLWHIPQLYCKHTLQNTMYHVSGYS